MRAQQLSLISFLNLSNIMASNHDHADSITLATKQHDGGSESNRAAIAVADAASKPKVDAFTKYSSNLIRMKELLLLGDETNRDDDEDLGYLATLNEALRHASISGQVDGRNNNSGDASKRRRGNDPRPIPQQGFLDFERNTRLSFKLHPSLLLHDLIHQDGATKCTQTPLTLTGVSGQISDYSGSGSDRLQSFPSPLPRKTALKSSLFSVVTPRSKAVKHVKFTFKDNQISYEVTKDDIKNSWLDIDVSRAIEAAENESRDMIVSFGPTGRFTVSDMDACKNGKGYMVRIQKSRLINEMLGQRTNLRQSVLEEQAHQKREGVVDAEEICLVASKHSSWGVELAKSSWWLCGT